MKLIKRLFLYLLPLLIAFSAMIAVNENARETIKGNRRSTESMKMDLTVGSPNACTWNCYNDTGYCKQYHVKFAGDYFAATDPLYFGMISVLLATGDYGIANVLFLVVLWPLLMSYLLVKPMLIQFQIRRLRKNHD